MDLSSLENLGLTKKEAELYTELVRLGESPVADLIKATHSHPPVIYRSIDSLVDKGLVVVSIQRKRKYLRAEDPRVLQVLQEKQASRLAGLIPELLSLQTPTKEALVRVSRGNEAVRELRLKAYSQLQAGETYYIIGASGSHFYQAMGEQQAEIERIRVKRGVNKKLIAFESQREDLSRNETVKNLSEYRYLSEEFPSPSSTNIYGDTTALIIWSEIPVVIMVVSPEIAESYRYYFHTLWNTAKN